MNEEAVIRAAFFMCKALGWHTGRRSVALVLRRILGYSFRWSVIDAALHGLGTTRGPLGDHSGTSTHAQNGDLGTTAGHSTGTKAVRSNVSNNLELDSSLRSSSCVVPTPQAEKATNLKLPFDRPILDLRHAILKAVWRHVEPIIGRSTTWANWRARNARVAEAFARGGFTPEQIERAWELASKDQGENVRELSRIQRYLERVEGAVAMRKGRT